VSPRPRLAESAAGLWDALRQLTAGGTPDPVAGGVDYPVLLVPALGHFTLDTSGRIQCTNLGDGGLGSRDATEHEAEQVMRAVAEDQAVVVTLSPAGFRSGYGLRATRQVLHDPRGRWPATDAGPTERPLAAAGLTSYRCRGRFGWIMIGARDDADALREARRSWPEAASESMQVWDGRRYVPTSA